MYERALSLRLEDRREFLDRACGEDAVLRACVEKLLRLHGPVSGLLAPPPTNLPRKVAPRLTLPRSPMRSTATEKALCAGQNPQLEDYLAGEGPPRLETAPGATAQRPGTRAAAPVKSCGSRSTLARFPELNQCPEDLVKRSRLRPCALGAPAS